MEKTTVLILLKEKIISGKYTAKVRFESGPATVDVDVIKRDDKWFISSFVINSDALKSPPKQSSQ